MQRRHPVVRALSLLTLLGIILNFVLCEAFKIFLPCASSAELTNTKAPQLRAIDFYPTKLSSVVGFLKQIGVDLSTVQFYDEP